MDLRRLNHLVILAEVRHFGRAAERCHLSQPAFSRSIAAAEQELGLQLFNRGTPEVTCTHAGQFVVERASKLLFESRCLQRDVSMYRERQIGDIAFGVGPFPAATLLSALLSEMRRSYPGIHSRVEVNNADHLTVHLRAELLDFFVADMRNIALADDLCATPIGRLEAMMCVRPGHPLAGRDATLAAVAAHGLASVKAPDAVLLALGQLVGLPTGQALQLAITCDDIQVLKNVAMATDTVAVCPKGGVADELASGRLLPIQVTDIPPLFADMGVVSLRGRAFSAMAEFAVGYLGTLIRPVTG
jgi:DNA-binding transcriptional LysR family regulator